MTDKTREAQDFKAAMQSLTYADMPGGNLWEVTTVREKALMLKAWQARAALAAPVYCGHGCACVTQCGDAYDHAGKPKPPAIYAAPLQQPQEGWNREAAMEKIAAERIAIIQKADRTPAEADRLAALTADLNALSPRVTQSMIDDLRAMTAELRKPQEGWVSVPSELTEAMHQAAVRTLVRCSGNDDFPPRVWRAMIAAAPSRKG